jgi:hypothetical protein
MTPPRKRTSAEVWAAAVHAADDPELADIDAMSDAEIDAELRAHGIAPDDAADVGRELLAKPVRRPPARRGSNTGWVKWAVLAAAIALVLGALVRRREGEAHLQPEPIQKDQEPAPPETTPAERAASLREDGLAHCRVGLLDTCEAKLNAARALDPAGEDDPRVREARRQLFPSDFDAHGPLKPRPEKPPL